MQGVVAGGRARSNTLGPIEDTFVVSSSCVSQLSVSCVLYLISGCIVAGGRHLEAQVVEEMKSRYPNLAGGMASAKTTTRLSRILASLGLGFSPLEVAFCILPTGSSYGKSFAVKRVSFVKLLKYNSLTMFLLVEATQLTEQ